MRETHADPPRDVAARIRQDRNLGGGYVDVFAVIRELGIEVYLAPFVKEVDGLEGAHMVKGGRAFVFVNNERAITRQRLTAAHELGHHMLDNPTDGSAVFESDASIYGDEQVEQDAYRFARCFLMDPAGVRQLVSGIEDERERVAAVAATCVVSPEVAAIHLHDLGLISIKTKLQLAADLGDGTVRPKKLLTQYGYKWTDTPRFPSAELDARFMGKVVSAYEQEWITLKSAADLLGMTQDEARDYLANELGMAVEDPE
jgi:Zn-dependent peptidase ImmA (M78 family)